MYQEHFGLTRELFRSNSEGESIYVGPQQLATIARLRKALATPDAIVALTGPVGVGKSAIAERALEEIAPERMLARIGRMRLGPDEVLELLLESFSVARQPAGTIQRFVAFKRLLRDLAAGGTRPFILVEDARRIGTDALLEVEALTAAETSGAAAANIILLGDSELDTLLADPGLARMKQRIRLRHTVTPFTESDTEGCLRRCVSHAGGDFGSIFASGTIAALHACSGGIPRVLINICESVLTEAADRGERPVTAALVSTVASDVHGIDASPVESNAVTNALEPESAELAIGALDDNETGVAESLLDDDMQEPVHVADDDDTLEAAILDEQGIPSIDEVLAAPEQQERDWGASEDEIPVLTAEMQVAAANDEEDVISLACTPDGPESAGDAGNVMPDTAVGDIDELELALSVTDDVIEESPDASRDDVRPAGELPEITLDNELDTKKAPAPVTNLSRWQEELALAKGLEDISDVLAETVFGDKVFDELAAQNAFNPDPDQLDGLSFAEESPPAAPVKSATASAQPAPATTVSQQDRSDAWQFDMSVSRRFELVKELGRAQKEREINANSMVEITLGEDGYPVDASQGLPPEPIAMQIDTEITQSRMALKPDDIEKLAAKEESPPEPEKESRGLFGLFRRSTRS